jgi:cytochrome c oxidase cbb3-type subunit III
VKLSRLLPPALVCSLAGCLALLTGCDKSLPGKPSKANRPVPADQITEFVPLYQMYCAGCHGADGRLGPAPPLNDGLFLTLVPDAELLRLVDVGRPGTPMPGFSQQHGGPLTKAQVRALAEGIKPHFMSLEFAAKRVSEPPLAKIADLPAYAFVPPADKTAAADALQRGQRLFAHACGECHGNEGEGGGAGRLNEPDFLALISDQTLRRIIITGRPDLGMPDYATTDGRPGDYHPLSSTDIDDLVALLASWRGTPAVGAEPAKAAASRPPRGDSVLTGRVSKQSVLTENGR